MCTNTIPEGSPFNKSFSGLYGVYIFKTAFELYNPILDNFDLRMAENILRKRVGFPLIGEGWIAETDLYKRIKADFPNIEIIHHGKPLFLGRQEYKIAIEYQGIQHYKALGWRKRITKTTSR